MEHVVVGIFGDHFVVVVVCTQQKAEIRISETDLDVFFSERADELTGDQGHSTQERSVVLGIGSASAQIARHCDRSSFWNVAQKDGGKLVKRWDCVVAGRNRGVASRQKEHV